MKIVVLDGYTENPGDLSWDALRQFGDLTVYDRTSYEESPLIAERMQGADIVVMNKTPISRQTIDCCPDLKLIAVLATGFNVVDIDYARERGIPVVNVPVYGTASVSQLAISLLLEVCHHVGAHSESVHAGEWASNADWCYWNYPLIELEGKTFGLCGCGKIGGHTGAIAKALGMRVLIYDPYPNDAGRAIGEYVTLDELFAQADVIGIHMKDGVIIINNSRGQIVAEQDLADALNSGKVAAAALDVVSTEPIRSDNPLLRAKNCIITPHISWAPKESRQRIMDTTADNIRAWLDGHPINVVNGCVPS